MGREAGSGRRGVGLEESGFGACRDTAIVTRTNRSCDNSQKAG